jgi:hypothetical protein
MTGLLAPLRLVPAAHEPVGASEGRIQLQDRWPIIGECPIRWSRIAGSVNYP